MTSELYNKKCHKALVYPLSTSFRRRVGCLLIFEKNGIGSPSQSIYRFVYLRACKTVGKTENRQVWIDFPYPKEIFLALLYG